MRFPSENAVFKFLLRGVDEALGVSRYIVCMILFPFITSKITSFGLKGTLTDLCAESKNNSITCKFAHILDVFLCVSQNAK